MKKLITLFLFTFILFSRLIFAQEGEQPNPGSEYRLTANDLLEISVYQEPDLSKTVRVSSEGTISFPLLGNISVIGLNAKEVESKLTDLLAADYLVNPQVSVFIKEHAKIFISGEVVKPGAYEIKSGLTVMEAITLAGGFTDKADSRKIKLNRVRDGKSETIEIDYTEITEDKSKDVPVFPNDSISVGELGMVSVLGQVKSPGRYTLKQNMTVVDAIALAGGITDLAAGNGTKVIRMENGQKRTFTVPLQSILRGGDRSRDITLAPDDTIVVPESFF